MKILKIILLFLSLIICFETYADSPLTSIELYKAYKNNKHIKYVDSAKGILDEKICLVLLDSMVSIDNKIAIINKLGWDINGKDNSTIFNDFIVKYRKYNNHEQVLKLESAEVVICIAYLKSLDNYFEVNDAIYISNIALAKNGNSFTIQLIASLIRAQHALRDITNWCEVYLLVRDVIENENLIRDMNDNAVNHVTKYVYAYREYCK